MTDRKIIGITLGVVILNILVGHFLAPIGMMLTPIILIIVSSLIAFRTKNISPIWKSIWTFGLVVLHDIGIKLYAGGSHDTEGQGWIQMLTFIGLLPTFGILLTTILRDKQETILNKVFAIVLFPILIGIYLYLFNNLGLGRYYDTGI